jgi:hypothetical protein
VFIFAYPPGLRSEAHGKRCAASEHADERDGIGEELPVLGHEDELLDARLGNKKSVERISMMKRQRSGRSCMLWAYVDRLEAIRSDCRENVVAERKLTDLAHSTK